jgi:hypothetical protein
MLARLSMNSAQYLSLPFETSEFSIPEEDEEWLVDIDALKRLVQPLPDLAWSRVTGMCQRTIAPVCKSLQTMLQDDAERVARVLSELEPPEDGVDCSQDKLLPVSLDATNNSNTTSSSTGAIPSERILPPLPPPPLFEVCPTRKRRRSSTPPLVIPSTHPTTPTIVITPCNQPQPCDVAPSRPPFQDSSFGNRLTLPKSYPVFNDVFPPLLPTALHPPLSSVERWQWVDGHWRAVLPTLEEQVKSGLFSRPVAVVRKKGGYHPPHPPRGRACLCDTSVRAC